MKNLIIGVLGILVLLFSIDNFGGVKIFPKKSCDSEKCDSTACHDGKGGQGIGLMSVNEHCNDDYRYRDSIPKTGGGYSLRKDVANLLIEKFPVDINQLAKSNTCSGAYLSKRAIDSLFEKNKTDNGLVMCFVKINDTTISLVVTPTHSDRFLISYRKSDEAFLCETFCPKICGCFQSPYKSNLFTILYTDMNLNLHTQ